MVFVRNKKGEGAVGTALIVIIALAGALSAGFVFASFNAEINDISVQVSEILSRSLFGQEYVIAEASFIGGQVIENNGGKSEFIELADNRGFRLEEDGNFFGKIRNGEFSFNKVGNGYEFKIENLFVEVNLEKNKVRKNFDLYLEFNEQGVVVKRELTTSKDFTEGL